MEKTFNKLVRDKIPEIIEKEGYEVNFEKLSDEEYEKLLKAKVLEEAKEVFEADDEHLTEEIGDLTEVLLALMKLKNITSEELTTQRDKKNAAKGKFESRYLLKSIRKDN